ncbi:MAG: TIGR03936 family radical SAM-associated protein [Oscillospiraceae bacterium]|nr:TIGR03936 family radical SAM-associated protein [Oscillospiraceae bacterium]
MTKCRIRFEKTGRAKYISHLDLMRTFQHAFIRSGIKIKHTEGFNPHPYISMALPLQLGCESVCEVLDIQIEDDMSQRTLPEKLNPWLPEGIRAISAALPINKVGLLKYVRCSVTMVYDDGKAAERKAAIEELFARESLIIMKKTKRGMGELDLAPNVSEVSVEVISDTELKVTALVSAVEPTVNPSNLLDAVKQNAPELEPDFAKYMRLEVYDGNMKPFM